MTAAEGNELMRAVLINCGLTEEAAEQYPTHSMKRTILDWGSCSGAFSYGERRCIGHHLQGLRSEPTYSQDEMSRLHGKIERIMIAAMRMGQLDPDAKGATRIKLDNRDMFQEESSEESEIEEVDPQVHSRVFQKALDELHPPPPQAEATEESAVEEVDTSYARHIISEILHHVVTANSLACGRPLNRNYLLLDLSDKDVAHESLANSVLNHITLGSMPRTRRMCGMKILPHDFVRDHCTRDVT